MPAIIRNIFIAPLQRANTNLAKELVEIPDVPSLGNSVVGNPVYDEVAFLNGTDPLADREN